MTQIISYRLLVLAYITAQRQLIHEKTASRSEWNEKYDFIVVGAGSAGSVVANRLTEDKTINILLLESGGPQSAIYNDIPGMFPNVTNIESLTWLYYNEPQDSVGKQYSSGRIPEQRGKTLGGSSAHNAMNYVRGNRLDFDNWVKTYGAKGWSYEEVLPYFKKFENNTDLRIVRENPGYHSTSGPVQITTPIDEPKMFSLLHKSYKELGFSETDLNGANQTGYGVLQNYITKDRFRSSVGNAYIDPNPHPKNLHIVCKALVVKILFNGLTAIGVEFIKNSKSYKVFADKEVIISAGPINSPQLLMLSGIGNKSHLNELGIPLKLDLPVGDNYHNHVLSVILIGVNNSDLLSALPQLNVEQLSQLYFNRSGPLSQLNTNALYFSTKNNHDNNWPNIESATFVTGDGFLFSVISLVRPRSRGTIRLQSTNPLLPPLIDPNFLSHPRDYEDFVDGIRFGFKILETTSISQYISIPSLPALGCPPCPHKHIYQCTDGIKCLIKNYSDTGNHCTGSCKMGAIERSDTVVDPLLRVKNVRKLRVCDSSIFPQIPNGHLNAASIMVGERCSDFIKNLYNLC